MAEIIFLVDDHTPAEYNYPVSPEFLEEVYQELEIMYGAERIKAYRLNNKINLDKIPLKDL